MVKGIRTLEFGMAPAAMAACNASGAPAIARGGPWQSVPDERCEYPDMLRGAWNETLTFQCPTIITLPHFFKACLLRLSRVPACITHQHLVSLEGKLATAGSICMQVHGALAALTMQARWWQADPAIASSTGANFTLEPALHDSFSGVEPSAGFTLQARPPSAGACSNAGMPGACQQPHL